MQLASLASSVHTSVNVEICFIRNEAHLTASYRCIGALKGIRSEEESFDIAQSCVLTAELYQIVH